MRNLLLTTTVVLSAASASFAGGYTTPVVEAEPVTVASVTPVAPAYNWSGAYVGANVNWGEASADAKGDLRSALSSVGLGETLSEPEGASAAIRAGYDWQFNRMIVGLGAEYNAGKYDAGLEGQLGDALEADVELKNTATVFARAGYAFTDNIVGYGLLGYTWAKGEISIDGVGSESEDLDGVTVGLGGEYLINNNWSAYGEYAYTDFGDIDNTDGQAEAELHQVKLGLNYRF